MPRRCERTGVAMGHDARPLGNQFGAALAERTIDGDILRIYRARLGLQVAGLLHPRERPEKIHRGRTARAQYFIRLRRAFAEHHAKCRGHPDRRRPAHHHVANRLGDLLGGTAHDVNLLVG